MPDSNANQDSQTNDQIREVLLRESEAIKKLAGQIGPSASAAVDLLLKCQGRLIVSGMGKMGLVARKASATFCSTGTPAIFLHPGEAVHGDLGIVTQQDVVLALSNSGETNELNSLLPFFARLGVPVVSLTGNQNSTLAKHSDVVIDIGTNEEADPISMAPTTSTTVAMAMCDALAVALMHRRGFTKEQFAIFHPGGNLGRKLLLTTEQVMLSGSHIPKVSQTESLRTAMLTISQKRLGCTTVVDQQDRLIGILTDGDLRRTFAKTENPLDDLVANHMTHSPATIASDCLAAEALREMEDRKITVLPVIDSENKVVGMVHLHDLIQLGLAR